MGVRHVWGFGVFGAYLLLGAALALANNRAEVVSRDFPYSATGMLTIFTNDGSADAQYCSGTLVGPDLVLTAAHCFAVHGRVRPELFKPRSAVSPVTGKLGKTIYPVQYAPNQLRDNRTHPLIRNSPSGALVSYHWDVSRGVDWALVRLSEPVGRQLGYLGVSGIRGYESQPPFRGDQRMIGYHGGGEVGVPVELSQCNFLGRGGPGRFSSWKNFVRMSCTFGRDAGASGGPLMVQIGRDWYVTGVLAGYKDLPWPYRSESYVSDLSSAITEILRLR